MSLPCLKFLDAALLCDSAQPWLGKITKEFTSLQRFYYFSRPHSNSPFVIPLTQGESMNHAR